MYASVHIHQCLAQIWKFCEGRRNSGYWNVITPYADPALLSFIPQYPSNGIVPLPPVSPLPEYWNLTAEIEIYWNIVLSLQLSLNVITVFVPDPAKQFLFEVEQQAEKKFYNLAKLEDLLFVLYILWGNLIKTRRDTDWPPQPLLTAWAPASSPSASWTLYEVLLPRSPGTGTQPDNYIISATLWSGWNLEPSWFLIGHWKTMLDHYWLYLGGPRLKYKLSCRDKFGSDISRHLSKLSTGHNIVSDTQPMHGTDPRQGFRWWKFICHPWNYNASRHRKIQLNQMFMQIGKLSELCWPSLSLLLSLPLSW